MASRKEEIRKELKKKNVIFCDTDTALREHPDIFKKYFNTLVKYNENKFTALNGAVWSGGTFIYIPPPHTCCDKNRKTDPAVCFSSPSCQ